MADFTYNGGAFRFVNPQIGILTPRPKAAVPREWRATGDPTPGMANVLVVYDAPGVVRWEADIVVMSPAAYAIFYDAADNGFFDLVAPWGTESAWLDAASINNLVPHTSGRWYGRAVWEWTP